MVSGLDFKQANENLISMVEDMYQVTNAESDNLNILQDKLHEQTGYNPDHKTEVDNNVEYMNQSFGEGNSCNEKQDQQKAKASTPHIEAEFPISSKGECTRVYSEEVQVIELEEAAAIDKQPFTSKTHTIPEVGEEINASSKSVLEDLNQDKNAQLSSTEIEKDEKENEENCFSEIHQTKAVNSKEILNQSFEESNSWTETRDKEITQASTPPLGAENIQVSEIEKEIATGALEQQIIENENSMNTVKDVDQNMNTRSIITEAQKDEQTGSNENNVMGEANNENTAIQICEVSNHCGANQDQEASQGFTHLMKVENLVLSNEEFTSITSEGIKVSEVSEEATIDEQQCMLEITNREKTGVEVLLEKENSISIMEDVIQDLNAQSSSIEVQKTEDTNANSSSKDFNEIQAINHEDFLNQNYKERNSCSEEIVKDTAKAYTPQLKARTFDPSNNECTLMPSDELKAREDDKKTTIQEQQCCAKNEYPNGMSSDEVLRMKNVKGNQNFMNIIKDMDQDMTSESNSIDVLQDENKHNQAGSKDIHEIEVIHNEEIVSQSSKESKASSGKEDQDFSHASTLHLEAENDVQRNDECTSTCSEDTQVIEAVGKAAVEKKQCTSQDEDPNKTIDVSSNDITRMEIVQENEIFMNKVGDVDQGLNVVSDNIEVLQVENTDEQTGTKNIHDIILVNNEEIINKRSDEKDSFCEKKIQETYDACAQVEVIHHAPTQDECTTICSKEFQVSEVEEKSTIDKNQCSSATDDPNKTREGVYSHKDMNSQSNAVQKDEKTNEQIFSNEIHEMEGFSNQETVNQSFKENDSYSGQQDQKSFPSSTLLLETTDPLSSNDESTRPPSEEVKVGEVEEVEEEAVIVEQRCNAENGDLDKIKNVALPIEVGRADIVQDNENHHNIVEDVDQKGTFQDIDNLLVEADNIEGQRDEKAHTETSLYEIQDTKVVNKEETANQSSEENTCSEKQDQGTAEASEVRRKDERTRIKGEDIQVSDVKEKVAVEKLERNLETNNVNKITNGICPYEVKGLEIEQEYESSMNIEQDLDQGNTQGKLLQSESSEVQEVDQTHKKTCLNDFDQTEAVRQHVEIEDQSSKESDFCNDKEDQEIARASKPNIEAEYPVIDKSTMISSSKVEEEETIEIQQCNYEDTNDIKHDVSSYEGIKIDNVSESKLNQPVGTEISGQNGNIKKDGLDLSQSSKKSNDQTQLIEFNKAAGLESEHKHENEDPREMTNRFEEEVKHTNKSISTNEIDTVIEKVEELGASIAGEVSSVQNVLAPEFGISRESIDKEDKQVVDTIKTTALLERNNMKALEVSSNDEIQHLSVIKEFTQKVEAFEIVVAEEVELIKLTEIDHDSQDNKASTELHAKKFLEDQEFDDAKHEAKLSKATISDVNTQGVTEIKIYEAVQKHIWQASEPLDQLQEPSSKECEQTVESIKTRDKDESTYTMKVQKDEKPNDLSEKTSQGTCLLEEEQRELEVSNSDLIPSVNLLESVAKNVTTTNISHKPEPENKSSEFQGATSASEYELNSGHEMSIYSCSQESKKVNECQSLEKSEQTNDISLQHESSPELISERNVVNMCELASDIQGKTEIIEHIAKQYDQELINSEDCNEEKKEKAANTKLIMGENKSKEDHEEYKDSICDTTITKVRSIDDFMKEAYKQPSEKNAFEQVNHLVQSNEFLQKLTESNEMNGSNSQVALLQRDMGDDFDISTFVETQKINDRQTFPPKVVEIDISSARDAEEITDVSELERGTSDASSKETKANQFSEKLEQDDAKGGIKFQDQMAIHMHYQDVTETDVVARHISQANDTDEKLQAPAYQNLEETNETTKPVTEMEGKTDDSLSDKQVKEICVPEKEQKELEVLNLKDEPIDDSLSKQELVEIIQTTGDSTIREPEDLSETTNSAELETTNSSSKSETSTEPINYSKPSSQTKLNKTKVQDLKSTEYHELTKRSQQTPEPKTEELAKSEKTLQEKDRRTKSKELLAEDRSLNNFGAHEAVTDVVNYDKTAVLSKDPTLAQQNLQETVSHDNVEKRKMGEEQVMMTEFSNSFVDDGTDAKATRQGLLKQKDSEGVNEIQNMRELNFLYIEEKEQEHQEKCEKLLDSSQFQESLSNVPKEASIDDIKQLKADNKEEHNEIEAYAQKCLSTIESKRIGVTSNDPVKENSESAITVENSSIAKSGYSEQIPENLNKTQINSITLDTTNKQQEIILHERREDAAEKPKSNEENDNEHEESELKLPLISEDLREIDPKITQKRSQNILSGVGSKVKHSISKVKKAIACSSSQFEPEEVIIKLNKNKKN